MNGAWGVGPLAFEQLFEMLPYIGFGVLFLGGIWLISKVRA
ncbi:hypothetical protein [Bradyrhizobium sp. Arg816]|nr:hypothetical protein [Bradyrhizobium sp. Arg816]MDI3563542.1 hypothetical protein [Bradyrhizobium sp. Arg816]